MYLVNWRYGLNIGDSEMLTLVSQALIELAILYLVPTGYPVCGTRTEMAGAGKSSRGNSSFVVMVGFSLKSPKKSEMYMKQELKANIMLKTQNVLR